MVQPPLLIIYQQTMKTTAFCLLHLLLFAGWLWLIVQADQKSQHGKKLFAFTSDQQGNRFSK